MGGKRSEKAAERRKKVELALKDLETGVFTSVTLNGFPPRAQTIREMAEEIRHRRITAINDASIELIRYDPIGEKWPMRFLARHPELQSIYAWRIDIARLKESTPETIQEWFGTFERVKREYDVAPKNIYNMDETGFSIGSVQRGKVITPKFDVSFRQIPVGKSGLLPLNAFVATAAPLIHF
jgi:hypothetical protein